MSVVRQDEGHGIEPGTVQGNFRKHFRIIQVDTEGNATLLDFNGVELP